MRLAVFATAAAVALQPAFGARADAQVVGGCTGLGTGMRTAGGAFLGAWVGFVVAKMKLSDWNEASHSPAAIRQRNQITIGGAVLGGLIGNLAFRSPCRSARNTPYVTVSKESLGRRAITKDEIEKSGVAGSVYDLVYALRRSWLSTRGVGSVNEAPRYVQDARGNDILIEAEPELIVYLDDMRLGPMSQLRELPVAGIVEVRYYDPSQATFKWGSGHARGAIQVISVSNHLGGDLRPQPYLALPHPSP